MIVDPTTIFINNKSAIDFLKNSRFHAHSKHIDIQHHFVREKVNSNKIKVLHCMSADNLMDICTKPLSAPTHQHLVNMLNLDTQFRVSVVE